MVEASRATDLNERNLREKHAGTQHPTTDCQNGLQASVLPPCRGGHRRHRVHELGHSLPHPSMDAAGATKVL